MSRDILFDVVHMLHMNSKETLGGTSSVLKKIHTL